MASGYPIDDEALFHEMASLGFEPRIAVLISHFFRSLSKLPIVKSRMHTMGCGGVTRGGGGGRRDVTTT